MSNPTPPTPPEWEEDYWETVLEEAEKRDDQDMARLARIHLYGDEKPAEETPSED